MRQVKSPYIQYTENDDIYFEKLVLIVNGGVSKIQL